jgi:hypothetical protein
VDINTSDWGPLIVILQTCILAFFDDSSSHSDEENRDEDENS